MKVAERKGQSRYGGSRRAGGVEGSSVAVVVGSMAILSFAAIVVAGCVHNSGTSDVVATLLVPTDAQAQTTAPVSASGVRAVLDQYCVGCHNEGIVHGEGEPPSVLASRLRASGIALDILDVTRPSANAEAWERVIRKLRTGTMPPAGMPRPDETTYDVVASSLEAELDRAWEATPNPGRVNSVHRLNRTEYNNAIRDLFALDMDVTSLLPGDETTDGGFDNNADALSITMVHVERYMSVARQVTRLATGLPPATPRGEAFDVPEHVVQNQWRQSDDLPLGSRGGVAVRYPFPVDGEYLIKVRLRRQYADFIEGMGWPQQLDILLDGKLLRRFVVGGEAPGTPATASNAGRGGAYPRPGWDEYMQGSDDLLEVRVPVNAGTRVVGVAFVRDIWEPEFLPQAVQPARRGFGFAVDQEYMEHAAVGSVEITGPYEVTGAARDTPSRREIFTCHPRQGAQAQACATEILSRMARRAYRRSVTERDVAPLLEAFDIGRQEGGSFDTGIQFALEQMLVSPAFLLRLYPDPAEAGPGQPYRLSDWEVASRLSFFLWSSIPDEELLDLAESGRLTGPAVLEQQVRRMLTDPRAIDALVEDFAAQWLNVRRVKDVLPDTTYPRFDMTLLEALQRETELFVASTVRENRSVLDLLRADYTFLNERLARHYGISGVYGSRFRRVTLPDREQRGGLLGQGALLAVSSYANRTSPVLRGKWLLDNIIGSPPNPPPPDVDTNLGEPGPQPAGIRERLAQHRTDPVCSSCHSVIDPLGFALENFDVLGGWRTVDEGGNSVYTHGQMLNGVEIQGLAGLRGALLDQPEDFVRTVTEKLMAYALARRLEYYDQPTVRRIVREAASDEYRWSSIILGIVKSDAFLMRTTAMRAD